MKTTLKLYIKQVLTEELMYTTFQKLTFLFLDEIITFIYQA